MVIFIALVLIVGLAYVIRSRITTATLDSMQWVSHTHEVKATVFELAASLNEMEASAFAAQSDPLSEQAAHRYGEARARYAPLLQALRELTRDNPAQQERIGMLRAEVEGRVKLFDAALLERAAGRNTEAGQGLETAVTRFPLEDVLKSIVDDEERLVAARKDTVERRARIGGWIIGAVSLVQLLLLAAIVWASENQLRRRLVAEAAARQAVERAQLILATVREPIAVVTRELTLLTCNRAFTDYYALGQGDALGGSAAWSDGVLLQRLRDVPLTQREIWDYELTQAIGTAESRRHVVVNARPMQLPDAHDTVILLTISDITAR